MKAIVMDRYGSPDVLRLEEVPDPAPKDDEVLIRVHAASVNAGDWHILRADPFLVRLAFGLVRPKVRILGSDVAGRVEAVGPNVTRFQPGDAVFADVSPAGYGAFAELVCAPERLLAAMPAGLSFEEAAAVPAAAVTALQGLRNHGKIAAGQQVLINGASGGVGSFAVQLARALGAEVTGVCSTANVELVRSLGAAHVIDYSSEDVTRGGRRYDLVLDAAAYRSIFDYRRVLTPQGRYVFTGGATARFLQASLLGPLRSRKGGQSFRSYLVAPNGTDLAYVAERIGAGEVKPVISRRHPLSEVAEAIRFVEEKHPRGKVVITVQDG